MKFVIRRGMNIQVYNQSGEEAGTMELPKVFALPWNANLVHQVVTSEMANRRPTLAHTKGRGEVRGGGRKPWRQKGTGRARHGSIRSPIWKGGGVAHGPTKDKNFKRKINRAMAAKALATVLSAKVRDHQLLILDDLSFAESKTKIAAATFSRIARVKQFSDLTKKEHRALLLLPAKNDTIVRAGRNLPYLRIVEARNITALDALNHKYLVVPKQSIEVLEKRLAK